VTVQSSNQPDYHQTVISFMHDSSSNDDDPTANTHDKAKQQRGKIKRSCARMVGNLKQFKLQLTAWSTPQ